MCGGIYTVSYFTENVTASTHSNKNYENMQKGVTSADGAVKHVAHVMKHKANVNFNT